MNRRNEREENPWAQGREIQRDSLARRIRRQPQPEETTEGWLHRAREEGIVKDLPEVGELEITSSRELGGRRSLAPIQRSGKGLER